MLIPRVSKSAVLSLPSTHGLQSKARAFLARMKLERLRKGFRWGLIVGNDKRLGLAGHPDKVTLGILPSAV